MVEHTYGPFGKFSAAGFVILSLLYIVDVLEIAAWPVSPGLTGAIALLAGLGAALLWFGNDPTGPETPEAVRTD